MESIYIRQVQTNREIESGMELINLLNLLLLPNPIQTMQHVRKLEEVLLDM